MRYFFHIYDDLIATDDEGSELADVQAATDHARIAARALIGEQARAGCVNLSHRIEVEDEQGRAVGTMWFRDAVHIHP